jgi:hypothetical protein
MNHETMLKIVSPDYYFRNNQIIKNIFASRSVGKLLNIYGAINRFDKTTPFVFDSTPVPEDYQTSLSFSDVSLNVAREIWTSNPDKKICVFWSGGIDSTVALSALIMTNSDYRNRITVYTSEYSIQNEYPLFFDMFVKNMDYILLKDGEFFNPALFNGSNYVIDGCCGDQIWGCNIMEKMDDIRKKHYSSLYKTDEFKKCCGAFTKTTIEYIENLVESFPTETKTVSDLYWLLTFTHKWDHVRRRHMANIKDISVFNRMNSFFNHVEYQKWAMTNTDMKVGETWNTYKQPAKDFIFELTDDNDYRVNKLQHESMGHSITNNITRNYYKLVTDNSALTYEDNFEKSLRECYTAPC